MKQKLFCKAHPDVRLHFRVKGNRPKGTFTKVQRHLHSRLLDWFCPKCERQPKCAFASVVGGTEPGASEQLVAGAADTRSKGL